MVGGVANHRLTRGPARGRHVAAQEVTKYFVIVWAEVAGVELAPSQIHNHYQYTTGVFLDPYVHAVYLNIVSVDSKERASPHGANPRLLTAHVTIAEEEWGDDWWGGHWP